MEKRESDRERYSGRECVRDERVREMKSERESEIGDRERK